MKENYIFLLTSLNTVNKILPLTLSAQLLVCETDSFAIYLYLMKYFHIYYRQKYYRTFFLNFSLFTR